MNESPDTTRAALAEIDAKLEALDAMMRTWRSALRQELAARPPESSRARSRYVEPEVLTKALAGLAEADAELKSALRAYR